MSLSSQADDLIHHLHSSKLPLCAKYNCVLIFSTRCDGVRHLRTVRCCHDGLAHVPESQTLQKHASCVGLHLLLFEREWDLLFLVFLVCSDLARFLSLVPLHQHTQIPTQTHTYSLSPSHKHRASCSFLWVPLPQTFSSG